MHILLIDLIHNYDNDWKLLQYFQRVYSFRQQIVLGQLSFIRQFLHLNGRYCVNFWQNLIDIQVFQVLDAVLGFRFEYFRQMRGQISVNVANQGNELLDLQFKTV